MKRVTLKIHNPSINRIIGRELELSLPEDANIIDAIKEVDGILNKEGGFPSGHYRSLLHYVYNPVENRFYEQTGVNVYTPSQTFLDIRSDPSLALPDGTTVILLPEGGCISAREEVLNYEVFQSAMTRAAVSIDRDH